MIIIPFEDFKFKLNVYIQTQQDTKLVIYTRVTADCGTESSCTEIHTKVVVCMFVSLWDM